MFLLNICAFSSFLFIATGGFLQSEEITFLYGLSILKCLVLNMAIFDTNFLFVFKIEISGASTATIFSDFFPMMIILDMFYLHNFGLKNFSPNAWHALKVGFSSLIVQISGCISIIVVHKYKCNVTGDNQQDFVDVISGFNGAIRINNLAFSIVHSCFIVCICSQTLQTFL